MKTQLHWQQLPVVCAVLQSLFQLLLSESGADPGMGDLFLTMLLMNTIFP